MERRFDDFDTDFRDDFDQRYKNKGYSYDRYRPAYRYGFEAHNLHSGRDWRSVETDLRNDWQRNHPNDAWEDFKDAIHTGFDRFQQGAQQMGQHMQQGVQQTGQHVQQGMDRTTGAMSRNFDQYEQDFRSDFQRNFGMKGGTYDRYRPAYQYGYKLATDAKYRGRNWNDMEMDARKTWTTEHPGQAWDDFKDAVRSAYQRVRSDVKDTFS